jgi:hypothetical protein
MALRRASGYLGALAVEGQPGLVVPAQVTEADGAVDGLGVRRARRGDRRHQRVQRRRSDAPEHWLLDNDRRERELMQLRLAWEKQVLSARGFRRVGRHSEYAI